MAKSPQPSLPVAVLQSLWGGVVFCAVEFWKWPVISTVAGIVLAFGMSAMYGDQYIAAASAFFLGLTLFTARAVAESRTRKERAGVAAFIVLLGVAIFAASLWFVKHTYEGKTKNQTNILADVSEWTWRNVIAVVHVPWRWVIPSVLIAFVVASLVHVLRERKGDRITLSEPDPQLETIAKSDKGAIQSRVKLIGISYNPNFAKGYIDFTLAVHNDSIFDIVLQFSIKGDDLRFSPDWDRFHYELKMLTKEPVLCASRDGCFFTMRQPLTDGEAKQFTDDYDRVVGFSALDITIKGKDESDGVQSQPLKTDEYVYTKRGMWRVGDEMQALFVLAHQKLEAVEALAEKPVDQPAASSMEPDVSVLVFGVTVEVEPDGLAPRVYSGFAGTTGQHKPLKSFAMWIDPALTGITVYYRGYFEDGTSSDFVDEGGVVERQGENGKKLDIRGFCVKLAGADATKYDVVYSAHLQGTGDVERNYKNGEFCGTNDRAIEGMKVVVCKAGAKLPLLLA
jgi:hypothetical protein